MADHKKEDAEAYVKRTSSLAEANNHLAVKLHNVLAKEQTNVFFSPFSISTALSMLLHGTRGNAATEIRDVLGYNMANMSDDDVISSYNHLMVSLMADSKPYTLAVANSLVTHKDFSVKDQYKSDLKNMYMALVKEVDFVNEMRAALEDINNFVKENTNQMIPKLLDEIDPNTILVLLNAVYFKGTWLHQFKNQATKPEQFYNKGLDACAKEVYMMHLKQTFRFVNNGSYKALQMSYDGDIAMLILLPNSKNGLQELERSLSDNFMEELKKSMYKTKVKVSLPRFRMEYSKSLKETFQALGMTAAFQQGADFGGINDSPGLEVSEIIHKAVVEVNEQGSEAAAATAVVMVKQCAMVNMPEPEFTADHPFVFFIYDTRNNLIIFTGRVEEL